MENASEKQQLKSITSKSSLIHNWFASRLLKKCLCHLCSNKVRHHDLDVKFEKCKNLWKNLLMLTFGGEGRLEIL